VAKIKELVRGSEGNKEGTVSTPSQIHKVVEELNSQSGNQNSPSPESGDHRSQAAVKEILEKIGGD
jgi:hypothetical protein